nr:glycerol-3-phosphate 1-O-acyltransferase PlsY [candidate division Zixibacteria bacterium]
MYGTAAIISGYLLGAIPFALIIARMFGIGDIRRVGSGNIGATNAWRAAGPAAGILVAVFDIGKGVLAVLLVSIYPDSSIPAEYLKLIAGMAAVVGHIFPIFLLFRGGKGVNTALGVMLTLLPIEALIALLVFILTVSLSRYISLGSILAAFAFFVAVVIAWSLKLADIPILYVLIAALLMLLIIFSHRSNIKRLLNGTENRFAIHSGQSAEGKGDNV